MSGRLPYLNSRLQGLGATIFATMSALAEATGSVNLGQGFPDYDGPAEVLEAACEAIRAGHNQYPPGRGIKTLRDAIAEHKRHWYGLAFDPASEVLVTAGATEALAASILSLVEVGDEVVLFEPYYDAYPALVAMAGGTHRVVPLRPPTWGFDPDELRRAITPRTRLIVVNSPHNPTGKVFRNDELESIAAVCRDQDLIAVTDEVYEHLVFEGEHRPLATFDGMRDRTVTISSAGKTFSVTGWKIGWACASPPLLDSVQTAKQFLTYAGGAPFQHAVAAGRRPGHATEPVLRRHGGHRHRRHGPGERLLRDQRHRLARRRGRGGVLQRDPGALRGRRHPERRLLRPQGRRTDPRPLGVLQEHGDARGGPPPSGQAVAVELSARLSLLRAEVVEGDPSDDRRGVVGLHP